MPSTRQFFAAFVSGALLCSSGLAQKVEQGGVSELIELHPTKFSYLMTDASQAMSPDGSVAVSDRRAARRTPTGSKEDSIHIKWRVNAPKEEKYMVTVLAEFAPERTVTFSSDVDEMSFVTDEHGEWSRYVAGEITLPAGESFLHMKAADLNVDERKRKMQLRSVELMPSAEWPKHLERVKEFRAKGAEAKFQEKIYGVMFHWGNWALMPDGTKKEWPKNFQDLDIEAWADMVEEMGAGYVIFTTSWGEFFLGAPLQTIESINPGKTTIGFCGKDYYGEMMDALNKRGIEMILYFHHGQGDPKRYGPEIGTWWRNFWETPGEGVVVDASDDWHGIFKPNYRAIMKEIGERYGKRLYGWWVDDANILYPVDYHDWCWNMRAGNPNRLIAFNNGKYARYTDFQDYASGEWKIRYTPKEIDENGLVSYGRNTGLIPFSLVRAENHWAVYEKAPRIIGKEQNVRGIAGAALEAAEVGFVKTFNVMMYADGSVDEFTLQGLKNAKQALIDAGYERDFSPKNQPE